LWWGIIDLRAQQISPNPEQVRADDLLPPREVERLRNLMSDVIREQSTIGRSAHGFLEAILSSNIKDLGVLAQQFQSRGVHGIAHMLQDILAIEETFIGRIISKFIFKVIGLRSRGHCCSEGSVKISDFDELDIDTRYIGECLSTA
jgi:hypothetical protein